ncbi:hypothetical protein NPIL_11331, partial [Nephila pilipes]
INAKQFSLSATDEISNSVKLKTIEKEYFPVASSSGLQSAENVDSNSDEDLEEQSVPKSTEKEHRITAIPICFTGLKIC